MALHDFTTHRHVLNVVRAVPAEAQLAALRGANPAIHAEIERVSTQPRRSRDLTADTVAELIGWLSDPEAIAAIVAQDPRDAVAQAAKSRLRDLGAPPPPSKNSLNQRLRTERALAKKDPLTALDAVANGIDWDCVGEWFVARPGAERRKLAAGLVAIAYRDSDPSFLAMLFKRAFTDADGFSVSRVWSMCDNRNTSVSAHRAFAKYELPELNAEAAELICLANFDPNTTVPLPVTGWAIDVLRAHGRYDVLAYHEAVPAEEIRDAMRSEPVLSRRARVVAYCRSAAYADTLTPVLEFGTLDLAARPAAAALAIRGISTETRATLLRCASADEIVAVFSGNCGDLPDVTETVAFAKAFSDDHLGKPSELAMRLAGHSTESDNAGLQRLVDALWEHNAEFTTALLKRAYHGSWVQQRCMSHTATAFADHPDAWAVFFALMHDGNTAGAEMVNAVLATR